jgi:hypothetical protein
MTTCFFIQLNTDGKEDEKTPHSGIQCAFSEIVSKLKEAFDFILCSFYLFGIVLHLGNSYELCQLFVRCSKIPQTQCKILRADK